MERFCHKQPDKDEACIDFIYYNHQHVVFIEASVDDYRTRELPPIDDSVERREEKILRAINKWMGTDFKVEVKDPEGGTLHRELEAKYKYEYSSQSNAKRLDHPIVSYIIATTCRKSVRPNLLRIPDTQWIKVSYLENLVSSGIIPIEQQALILQHQTINTGRPET